MWLSNFGKHFQMKYIINIGAALTALLLLWSCNGAFDGVYDEPVEEEERTGSLVVDASDYKSWQYVDLLTDSVRTVTFTLDADSSAVESGVPASWQIAFHRNNVKTNGGAAYVSSFTTLEDSAAIKDFAIDLTDEEWVRDEWTTGLTYDLTNMMSGDVQYFNDTVNPAFSQWLNIYIPPMPPDYVLTQTVILLRLSDETMGAFLFTNFRNSKSKTMFPTFEYIYPL